MIYIHIIVRAEYNIRSDLQNNFFQILLQICFCELLIISVGWMRFCPICFIMSVFCNSFRIIQRIKKLLPFTFQLVAVSKEDN